MSKILMIRHLPMGLSFEEKKQLLNHFGAESVWETTSKRNYIFASFSSAEQAKDSLLRLHQLEIAHRRLVVEYSFEKEPASSRKKEETIDPTVTKNIKTFLRKLYALNPSVNFYQPPPPNLRYKYPEPRPDILVNIIHAIVNHKPLYVQTLHLMNKMCLDPPFEENKTALNYFIQTFRSYFIEEHLKVIPKPQSETESEISSDETQQERKSVPKIVKRKNTLPKTRKRVAAVLSSAVLPVVKKKPVVQEEVFEGLPIQETKKISVKVSQNALQKPLEEPEVIGELGKFDKKEEPNMQEEEKIEKEPPTISRKELLKNRISYSDMKILPVYKNYQVGEPSMRLYIKNLAKSVTDFDVKRIYKLYIENLAEDEQIGFDVRVMQEGRMKGQAFVTFPSVNIAEKALNETNGFLLKEKPMVVQFARVANKKSLD